MLDLNHEQERLESLGCAEGHARVLEAISGVKRAGKTGAPTKHVRLTQALVAMIEYLEAWKDEAYASHQELYRWCFRTPEMDVETIAFITLQTVVDKLVLAQYRRTKEKEILHYISVAEEVGKRIIDVAQWRRLKAQSPGLFKYKMSLTDSASGLSQKEYHLRSAVRLSQSGTADFAPVDYSDITPVDKVRTNIGLQAIKFLEGCSVDLFQVRIDKGYRGTSPGLKKNGTPKAGKLYKGDAYLEVTEGGLAYIDSYIEALGDVSPEIYPMVVPPLPWTKDEDGRGGFRYGLLGTFPFVRGDEKNEAVVREKADSNLLKAINAIQNTAWRVDQRVLDTLLEIRDERHEVFFNTDAAKREGVGGIPCPIELVTPDHCPAGASQEDIDKRNAKAKAIYDSRPARNSKRLRFNNTLKVARMMAKYEQIYLPFSCDYRGRLYSIVSSLSPQGDDVSKGLLRFANGKPLGPTGLHFLLLHGAATMDAPVKDFDADYDDYQDFGSNRLTQDRKTKLSKRTIVDAIEYMQLPGVVKRIQAIAADPIANRALWVDKESPVSFLAFAFEYDRFIKSGEGEAFVSSLLVSIDGSNNGVQHLSLLLRSASLGESVNIHRSDVPRDFYDDIRVRLETRMREHLTNPYAQAWANAVVTKGDGLTEPLISRSFAKKPGMTMAYGKTLSGLYGDLERIIKDNAAQFPQAFSYAKDDKATKEAAKAYRSELLGFMKEQLWGALIDATKGEGDLPGALDVMEWLQKSAITVLAASPNGTIEWTAPVTGFTSVQRPPMKTVQVNTIIGGGASIKKSRFQGRLANGESDLEDGARLKNHHKTKVAPNAIHSLDAAAMFSMVITAIGKGIDSFGLVHDSFATVAGDMDEMRRCTWFGLVLVHMAKGTDALTALKTQWEKHYGVTLDTPPVDGSLAPETVWMAHNSFR